MRLARGVLVVVVCGCGDGSGPDMPGAGGSGEPDGSSAADGSSDAAGSGTPDGAGSPDGAGGEDGAAGDAPGASDCPPIDGDGDGVTPVWLKGFLHGDPDTPPVLEILDVDDAADCSFAIAGYTRGSVELGTGEAGATALPPDVWFAAHFRADETVDWAVELGPWVATDQPVATVHVMPDGSVVFVRLLPAGSSLQRVSADGVVLGDPLLVSGHSVVHPLADGGMVAAGSGLERRTAAGEVVWSRAIGPYAMSIAELGDGRFVHVGGYEFGSGVLLNAGEPDEQRVGVGSDGCYIALYGGDGSLLWARTVDVSGTAVPFCAATAVGDRVVAWVWYYIDDWADFTISAGATPPVELELHNAVVVAYDGGGELAWYSGIQEQDEGSDVNIGRESLSIDPASGTVTIGGMMSGQLSFWNGQADPGDFVLFSTESNQPWFARYGADGSLIGPARMASQPDGVSSIHATATRSNGSVILAGTFRDWLVFGPFEISREAGHMIGFLAEAH